GGPVEAAAERDDDRNDAGDADASAADVGSAGDVRGDTASCPSLGGGDSILTFTLATGAFPGSGHPDVAVHVPPAFDACAPAALIVFFHGYQSCAANALRSEDAPCTTGGPVRP